MDEPNGAGNVDDGPAADNTMTQRSASRVMVMLASFVASCGGSWVPPPAPQERENVRLHVPVSSDSHRADPDRTRREQLARMMKNHRAPAVPRQAVTLAAAPDCATTPGILTITESTTPIYGQFCDDIVRAVGSLNANTLPVAPGFTIHIHLAKLATSPRLVRCEIDVTTSHGGNQLDSFAAGAQVSGGNSSATATLAIQDCTQAAIADVLDRKVAPSLKQFIAQRPGWFPHNAVGPTPPVASPSPGTQPPPPPGPTP